MATDTLLNVQEVATWLQMSTEWVREHARGTKPVLPSVRLGGRWRFREEEIEQFIQECAQVAKKSRGGK